MRDIIGCTVVIAAVLLDSAIIIWFGQKLLRLIADKTTAITSKVLSSARGWVDRLFDCWE